MFVLAIALALLRRLLGHRADLVAENLALRHQLAVLLRTAQHVQRDDRRLWVPESIEHVSGLLSEDFEHQFVWPAGLPVSRYFARSACHFFDLVRLVH